MDIIKADECLRICLVYFLYASGMQPSMRGTESEREREREREREAKWS